MPDINITVAHKVAVSDTQSIVCDNSDYMVHWTLDEEWSAYDTKTMRTIYMDGTFTDTVFSGDVIALPVCTVPGVVQIGLFAGDIRTSRVAILRALPSVRSAAGAPADPTPDVYDQLMELIKGLGGADPEAIKTAVAEYLTEHSVEETDPTVPAWAKAEKKPTYTAAEVGAVAQADLQTATDAALAQAKASVAFDGAKSADGKDGTNGKDGADGKPGAAGADGVTPHIGDNGNWYIGDNDTGKPSRGATGANGPQGPAGTPGKDGTNGSPGTDGITPHIGDNGNWYLGTTDTGKPSKGEQGPGAEVFYIDLAGDYPDYTCPVAMTDIKAAYKAGKVLECRCTMGIYTAMLPLFVPMPSINTWIFSGSGALTVMNFPAQSLTIAIVNGAVQASNTLLASKDDIPAALPNPNALTVKIGSTTVTYDGSIAQTVEIADGTEVSY